MKVTQIRREIGAALHNTDEPAVPRVTLNKDNYHEGVHAIVMAYRTHNNLSDYPYRILEKSLCFSVMHDATKYWVKQVNTMILRVISNDGKIVKVPYNMKKVFYLFVCWGQLAISKG